jgi:hypothetical protein
LEDTTAQNRANMRTSAHFCATEKERKESNQRKERNYNTGQDKTIQDTPAQKRAGLSAGADARVAAKEAEAEFLTAWNGLPSPFSHIAEWNQKRKTAFKARNGEPYFRNNWRAALEHMTGSLFCRGGGPHGWIADVEFFLRPGSVTKILEGKYDGFNQTAKQPAVGMPGDPLTAEEKAAKAEYDAQKAAEEKRPT